MVAELAAALEKAGLLPVVALDVAESICADPALAKELRTLLGDAVLAQHFQGRGLQDDLT